MFLWRFAIVRYWYSCVLPYGAFNHTSLIGQCQHMRWAALGKTVLHLPVYINGTSIHCSNGSHLHVPGLCVFYFLFQLVPLRSSNVLWPGSPYHTMPKWLLLRWKHLKMVLYNNKSGFLVIRIQSFNMHCFLSCSKKRRSTWKEWFANVAYFRPNL